MKKINTIVLVVATNFAFEIGKTIIKNKIIKRNIASRESSDHFEEFIFDSRSEAEQVLNNLRELVSDYGVASVADLYDLVGNIGSYKLNGYGWKDLSSSTIKRVRKGYLLDLPIPMILE